MMSDLQYGDRSWSLIGGSRIADTLLKPIGEGPRGETVFTHVDAGSSPTILYVATREGIRDLYRLAGLPRELPAPPRYGGFAGPARR